MVKRRKEGKGKAMEGLGLSLVLVTLAASAFLLGALLGGALYTAIG